MECRRSSGVYFQIEFESSVISYGSQTENKEKLIESVFESSVISYGSQTTAIACPILLLFESSVISYGSQTNYEYYNLYN